jgi:hypothetical protein
LDGLNALRVLASSGIMDSSFLLDPISTGFWDLLSTNILLDGK